MNKKILLTLLMLSALSSLLANKTIAIIGLDLTSIEDKDEREQLHTFFYDNIDLNQKYNLINPFEVTNKLDDENELSSQEICEVLNSNLLLSGKIRRLNSSYFIYLSLYSADKKKIVVDEKYLFSIKNSGEDKMEVMYTAIENINNTVFNNFENNTHKNRRGGSIEGSLGFVGMSLVDDENGWDYFERYKVLKLGYSYQFNSLFSLGGSLGALIIPANSEVLNNTLNAMFGINLIFGNKVDGFAGSLGLDIAPNIPSDLYIEGSRTVPLLSIGLYYKGFFLKTSSMRASEAKLAYLELGYSHYLGN